MIQIRDSVNFWQDEKLGKSAEPVDHVIIFKQSKT